MSDTTTTSPQPIEGVDRCHCGAKYWDGNVCHSCGTPFTVPVRFTTHVPSWVVAYYADQWQVPDLDAEQCVAALLDNAIENAAEQARDDGFLS